jgi:hypothetical protein
MSEERQQQGDPDPAPIKHSDAERVSGEEGRAGSNDEQNRAGEIEADPAHNPRERPLRDVKGG